MRYWKYTVTGFLMLCMLLLFSPMVLCAEEQGGDEVQEEETEPPIPDSYYYPIESNELPGWPQGPAIESASAVVMDMDTGIYLYSKNATAKQYPASITKIMTTLLLVENCDLDEEITFSEIVYDIEQGSSHLGIKPGEKMTLRDAAYGIMLASANDISNGVAEYIAGSVSGFADMMNARAAELGCVNTHFSNPHGLYRDDHYTCAYDMALIAQEAYRNPVFREIAGTSYYEIPETEMTEEIRYLLNHHKMLQKDEPEYYREWCRGGKNGYTEACLNTLVTYGEKDGRRLVAVVLRVNGAGKAYRETTQIMEYAFSEFETKKIDMDVSKYTFYDIMGLKYFGKVSNFQSPVWKRQAASNLSVSVTLPVSASMQDLQYEIAGSEDSLRKSISYTYEGWPVGTAAGAFYPFAAPVLMPFQRASRMIQPDLTAVSGEKIQIESVEDMTRWVSGLAAAAAELFASFAAEHQMAVLAGGAVLLLLLLIFLIVLIFRATADMRIRRKRRLEELERQKREEEIERMTAAEIESELRAAMEEERRRREQLELEQERKAQAEMEARAQEEKLHETERLLEELERERQERI